MVAPARTTLLTRRDDALDHRVIEREYDTATAKLTHQDTILYSRHWQRLETRRQLPQGGSNNPLGTAQLYRQHVWHAPAVAYVAQCCEQQTDTTGDGVLDQTLYFLQDAMYNVTAASDATGAVEYRLACSLYGQVETLAADYTPTPRPAGNLLAQQGIFLTAADLYDNRHRVRDPRLGRFLQEDPAGYVDGMSKYNIYKIPNTVDPTGLKVLFVSGEFCNASKDMCAIVWRDGRGGRSQHVLVRPGACVLDNNNQGDVADYVYTDGEWYKIPAGFTGERAFLMNRRFCVHWSYKKDWLGQQVRDKCLDWDYAPFTRSVLGGLHRLPLGYKYTRFPWTKPWTPAGTNNRPTRLICEMYCKCNLNSKNRKKRDDCGSMKECLQKCTR